MRNPLDSDADRLRAELYLRAVLPAMEELVELVPEARALVQDSRFALRFRAPGGAATTLRFEDGCASAHFDARTKAHVTLFFLSAAQLSAAFTGEGFSLPIPLRGGLRLRDIRRFRALAEVLRRYLEPAVEDLGEPPFRAAHVRLSLRVAVFALGPVARNDREAREYARHLPDGIAELRLAAQDYALHVEISDGTITTKLGKPPRRADAEIVFPDDDVAWQALQGALDSRAAVGLERLIVRGSVPMAQALEHIMDRIRAYLPSPVGAVSRPRCTKP